MSPRPTETVPPWLRTLVHWLDDLVPLPGLGRGVGLDPILGLLLPGAGDALTALGAGAVLVVAIRQGVPRVILARMVLHIAVDAILGAVPVAGDVFDALFRSNRRNLELLERYGAGSTREPSAIDYALVTGAMALLAVSVLAPLGLAAYLGWSLAAWLGAPP